MPSSSLAALARQHRVAFVLSTGRTGTMFVTQLVDRAYRGVRCVHEPPPSRTLLVAGNLRNLTGRGTRALRWLFESRLKKRLESLGPDDRYVEINPLLTSSFDLVERLQAPVRILHMTRDPRTWAPSIRTFKASGYRRHLIDLVPFAKPLPTPTPPGWLRMSLMERSLWQWRSINEQIEGRFGGRDSYARVRYEDLFAPDASVQRDAVEQALRALGLDPSVGLAKLNANDRINPAPPRPREPVDEAMVQRIGGELVTRYGYD